MQHSNDGGVLWQEEDGGGRVRIGQTGALLTDEAEQAGNGEALRWGVAGGGGAGSDVGRSRLGELWIGNQPGDGFVGVSLLAVYAVYAVGNLPDFEAKGACGGGKDGVVGESGRLAGVG